MKNFETSFEWPGAFWFPEDEEDESKRMYGTLSFDYQNGGRLVVLEQLQNERYRRGRELFNAGSIDIIHGIAKNKYLTLENNRVTRISGGYPEQFDFRVDRIYEGCLFNEREDIVFNTLYLQYTHLHGWLHQEGGGIFKLRPYAHFNEDGYAIGLRDYEFSYNPLDYNSIKILEDDEFKACLKIEPDFRLSGVEGVWAGYDARIIVESQTGNSHLDEYGRLVLSPIANFFTLATGRVSHPICISGTSEDRESVKVFYKLWGYEGADKYDFKPIYELFHFMDVKNNISDYFEKWISKINRGKMLRVCEHLFASYHEFFAEGITDSLMKALETYTRERFCRKKWRGLEFCNTRWKDYKYRHLYIYLRYEKGYRKMLDHFFPHKRSKLFSEQLKAIRNNFTHPHEDRLVNLKKGKARSSFVYDETKEILAKKLLQYNDGLKFILIVCLLIEMDMDEDVIKSIIERVIKIKWI